MIVVYLVIAGAILALLPYVAIFVFWLVTVVVQRYVRGLRSLYARL